MKRPGNELFDIVSVHVWNGYGQYIVGNPNCRRHLCHAVSMAMSMEKLSPTEAQWVFDLIREKIHPYHTFESWSLKTGYIANPHRMEPWDFQARRVEFLWELLCEE